ncbi:hypothetical protein D1159_03575 [Pseudoflavonifractor sp. 524-17]|uniref:hypothetical protein n=1 Tax=Pseudoflavonifractor sp. 524-17 TaxID=2304577 RepID=UPI00137B0142|nr:hypothetical protein [Pseudoflavonifractor sp. 524-17]NCE63679.1 hypothetical protein [Pseudoflavonifractor sp. 524-17]
MLIDKISFNLLESLYKHDLSESEVDALAGERPNETINLLRKENLISSHASGGIPDGEGGFLNGTVKVTYHIRPEGRAVVEQAQKEGVDKWLDRISNLIP